ncbi:MAG: hypothetical protein RBR87_06025 [Bacteroidales bacterium]|jgi:hypothetical protein|nr:hypothetical protein [Bacteroidales bacterium]
MKRKYLYISILIGLFLIVPYVGEAQFGSPPSPGGPPSKGNPPLGGGAPIGEGTVFLISLGAAYAVRKYRKLK